MKINKFSDTMSERDEAEYVSSLKDSKETLIITEQVSSTPQKARRKKRDN